MSADVLAIANEKGGVGKTTLSVQTAFELAARDNRVLLVEIDPSGDATTAFFGDDIPDEIKLGGSAATIKLFNSDSEIHPVAVRSNLYLIGGTDELAVIARGDMDLAYNFCERIEQLRSDFDYIIIDCPPSYGLLFTSAMLACVYGGVVIPCVPEDLAFKAAVKVAKRISQMNTRIKGQIQLLGVIPNKVTNPMPQSVKKYMQDMRDIFGDLLFSSKLDQTVKVSDAISCQDKLSDFVTADKDGNLHKSVLQLNAFVDELIERLDGSNR